MIKIKPACRSCILPPELIFLDIIVFYFIIQIILTDRDHWLLDIIQSSTSFFNILTWCNLLTWCYLFIWKWANNVGWHEGFVLDLLQKTYWIQTHVKHLIVQSKFKALLASEVFKFTPKKPHPRLGQSLILTGYSSILTYFTWIRPY